MTRKGTIKAGEGRLRREGRLRWIAYPIAIALATTGLGWGTALAQGSDGIPDQPDQPDQPEHPEHEHGDDAHDENRIVIERTDVRTREADGTRSRERISITVHPVTGERRERTRSEVRNPDGSRTKTRTETRIAEDGTILRAETRTRERAARGERAERSEDGERAERSERGERAERPDRPERGERPDRSDRERGERGGREK